VPLGQVGVSLNFFDGLGIRQPIQRSLLEQSAFAPLRDLERETGLGRGRTGDSPIAAVQMPAVKINIHEPVFAEDRKSGADAAEGNPQPMAHVHHFRGGTAEDLWFVGKPDQMSGTRRHENGEDEQKQSVGSSGCHPQHIGQNCKDK
jgi:hypothetical protein